MKFLVSTPDHVDAVISARDGWSVMEAMRDEGLPIRAECGGGKACGTCHIHVLSGSPADLPLPDEEEVELLQESDYFDPARSRLSCQILCADDLEGIRIAIQPDAYSG